jgi:hypothetical protein
MQRQETIWALPLSICLLTLASAIAQDGGDPSSGGNCSSTPCVTTHHNNNARTGVNSLETVLVANSFPSGFGASTTVSLDGMVYAQPLYVYGVSWAGSGACAAGTLNMVYVATENNTLYAIEADSPYAVCQTVSLNSGDAAIPVGELPGGPCNNLTGSSSYGTVGVTGTPVIDPASGLLFVVSAHQVGSIGSYTYTQRLNAVSITSLSIVKTLDLFTSVNAATPSGYPTFYALNESQRAGLTATKLGTSGLNIYVPWGTFCDSNIPSGGSFGITSKFQWIYSTSQFGSSVGNFYIEGTNTNLSYTPSQPAGIWMSGGAPAADGGGNVFVSAGNGHFEGVSSPLNFGNSIVKLGGSSFGEEDFYTPNVWSILNTGTTGTNTVSCSPYPNNATCTVQLPTGDWDLGSGGVVLLTGSSSTSYGELVAGGKEGIFYVAFYCSSSTQCPTTGWNRVMGGLDGLASAGQGGYGTNTASVPQDYSCTPVATALTPSPGNLAQCFYGVPVQATKAESGERSTPAYWPAGSTPYLYTVGTTDLLKAYSFSATSGTFVTTPVATAESPSGSTFNYPGATPSITSNGTNINSAVVWVLDTSAWNKGSSNQAVLTAYAAKPSGSSLTQLWTSGTSGPGATKFMTPTIANGKAYVGGQRVGGCGPTCTGLLTIYHQ